MDESGNYDKMFSHLICFCHQVYTLTSSSFCFDSVWCSVAYFWGESGPDAYKLLFDNEDDRSSLRVASIGEKYFSLRICAFWKLEDFYLPLMKILLYFYLVQAIY